VLVPVMQIRPVRMTVCHGFVRVPVRMACRCGKTLVGVRVMSVIVTVRMFVFHRLVRVFMLVNLTVPEQ
jgi:hypothetical protein